MAKKRNVKPEEKSELKPVASVTPPFLRAFSNLPKDAQKRTSELLVEFARNPRSPGINYETLGGAYDKKVRSLRVDLEHRAIILAPQKGKVYHFIYVDREEDAYQWALDKTFSQDSTANEITVTQIVEIEKGSRAPSMPSSADGLLAELDDEELISLGIPPILLPSVRSVKNPQEYHLLSQGLSVASIEALKLLAAGFSVDDVRKDYEDYAETPKTEEALPELTVSYRVPTWQLNDLLSPSPSMPRCMREPFGKIWWRSPLLTEFVDLMRKLLQELDEKPR